MAGSTVRVDGLRELGEAMRTLSKDIAERVARQATGAAAQVVKNGAKATLRGNPSIDTKLLHDNVIAKKVTKSKTTLTSEHIVTVRKRDYPQQRGKSRRNTRQVAVYKEFGTVNMPKEPSLGPGFERTKGRALEVMIARLKSGIEKARK
jgi:HK97 gp10 family phage protein